MNDIYDIKDILLSFPINITYSLIYLIFLLILFFIYKNFIEKNNDGEIIEIKSEIIKPKKDYYKILEKFKKDYLNQKENIFYSKLLYILRDILEFKWENNISKMTLKEINNLDLNINLKNLIKSIYYKEYMRDINDNNEIREKFIEDIKKIIK